MATADKRRASLFVVIILVSAFCLTQAAFGQVDIIGSWHSGTSHPNEPGTNRALIFIAYGEMDGTMDLTAVTYGGR